MAGEQQGSGKDRLRQEEGSGVVKRVVFATLVFIAILIAVWVGMSTETPRPTPDFALQAESIYRFEISLAAFLCLYVPLLAFFLALEGRGFIEIGVKGLKAQELGSLKQQDALVFQDEALRTLWRALPAMQESIDRSMGDTEARLRDLERWAAEQRKRF